MARSGRKISSSRLHDAGSNETILQAAELSSAPVLYSHGGSRHFVDTPRNLTDEAAKKIASKGGVVGLQFGNTFSNRAYYEWRQKGRRLVLPCRGIWNRSGPNLPH